MRQTLPKLSGVAQAVAIAAAGSLKRHRQHAVFAQEAALLAQSRQPFRRQAGPRHTTWTESILWDFPGGVDGGHPAGIPILIKDKLYGTASEGNSGYGVVFEVKKK